METRIRAGRLKIVGFFDDVRVLEIPEEEVARLAAPEVVFMNVNTPDELARARVDRCASEVPASVDARVDGLGISSIQEINALPREVAEALYVRLVPEELFGRFGISPVHAVRRRRRATGARDRPRGQAMGAHRGARAPSTTAIPRSSWTSRCRRCRCPSWPSCRSPIPAGPRYAIDRDPDGRDTLFGTVSRNLDEELRAMKDGLAPGQVRPRPPSARARARRDGRASAGSSARSST